ncbi:MAG: winged helix-turn-helix domain-containing protein [Actinomycetota bacterium]|nr:winged helix-turn-helix domain-containing protein [Actinomycetota bacterium]
MRCTNGPYEESVALHPWDYGGPDHVNRVPYLAIVDADGRVVDVEDGFGELFPLGRLLSCANAVHRPPPGLTRVPVSSDSPLHALLAYPRAHTEESLLRVTALGCSDLEGDESCGRWLGRRPGRLLKFLVCRRYRVVHAQEIAEALWGHAGFVSSGTVRQCVHELREKVQAGRGDAASQLVVTRQSGYALSAGVAVDADDFAVHVRRGIGALSRDQREVASVHLRRAVSMYRGDFLSDEPQAEWAHPERERLREHMEDALDGLARLHLVGGDAPAATLCLRRLAEMRPLDEDVHRRLLTVLLFQGRHSHAWRCYQAFCARLSRELSRTPDFALADLKPQRGDPAIAPASTAGPVPAQGSST